MADLADPAHSTIGPSTPVETFGRLFLSSSSSRRTVSRELWRPARSLKVRKATAAGPRPPLALRRESRARFEML